jgi:uncharacterized protein YaaW (UPF0174 family)
VSESPSVPEPKLPQELLDSLAATLLESWKGEVPWEIKQAAMNSVVNHLQSSGALEQLAREVARQLEGRRVEMAAAIASGVAKAVGGNLAPVYQAVTEKVLEKVKDMHVY